MALPSISLSISAGLAIILGLVVLLKPKALRLVVGIWLLVYGITQFLG